MANDGAPCPPGPLEVDESRLPDALVLRLAFGCPAPVRDLSIGYALFFDLDAGHRALGRLTYPGGEEEFLFDRTSARLDLGIDQPAPRGAWGARFARILWLGVEHILTGYDHVLFLLALLIGCTRLSDIVKIVTTFTLAHSLTLGLAWFGVIALPARLVEGVIALSIAYVALENIFGRGLTRRWAVAGGFGLVHGLGFYGALRDLDLGGAGLVTTLLAFNLGVEVGQLAIVSAVYGPLVWWARRPWYRASAQAGSAMILVVAAWWGVERMAL